MDSLQLPQALAEIFKGIQRANKYIDETAPWVLAKDEANRPRLAAVLYNLCETLRFAATLLQPFMPQTAPKMAAQLGLDASELTYDALGAFGSHATYTVHKGEALFPRIDAEKELEELRMEEEKNRAAAAAAAAAAADTGAGVGPAGTGKLRCAGCAGGWRMALCGAAELCVPGGQHLFSLCQSGP